MKIGYIKQTNQVLQQELTRYGCKNIYTDLDEALLSLEYEDTFIVPSLHQATDTTKALHNMIQRVLDMDGIFISITEDIDSSTVTGKYFIQTLSVIVDFQHQVGLIRQEKAIKNAKTNGVQFERKPKLVQKQVLQALQLKEYGYSNSMVANV